MGPGGEGGAWASCGLNLFIATRVRNKEGIRVPGEDANSDLPITGRMLYHLVTENSWRD